ncbi:hypothetical protein ACH4ZU_36095 [Streptomyces sp. NPDC020472]|uniref:hypothetical protein n=1 Tax=Streptomyces sp. NPDC020472 TaxID=3365075 RepID=UPI0037938FB3
MRALGKKASVGVLAAGLFVAMTPSAFADVSGAYSGVDWNVRASTSTTSTVLVRVHALGTGSPDRIPCYTSTCGGRVTGGSYKCSSAGATYNTWTPVNYNGRKGWVADRCVTLGRIA